MKLPSYALAFSLAFAAGSALAASDLGIHPEDAYPDDLPRLTSPGPYSDFISQVQQQLLVEGFDPGPVNGDFGSKTQAALAQFQLSQALPASGTLDTPTLLALGIAPPEAPAQSEG